MQQRQTKYERLLARARELPAMSTAIAHPCDEYSLAAALDAARIGLIRPVGMLSSLSQDPLLLQVAEEVEAATIRMVDDAR